MSILSQSAPETIVEHLDLKKCTKQIKPFL